MMKKRLVAFGLAGVMLMGMSMNVFAADGEVSDDTQNKVVDTTITYTVPVSYTVTIPTILTYNSESESANELLFKCSNAILNEKGAVNIGVDSDTVQLGLAGSTGINYGVTLKKENNSAITAATAITFTNENYSSDQKIKIVGDSTPAKVAGTYSKTIAFTVSYKEDVETP